MIYKVQLEKLFTCAGLLVGHERPMLNPNDFFESRMGSELVILYRDRNDKLHVLLAKIVLPVFNRLKFPVHFGRYV